MTPKPLKVWKNGSMLFLRCVIKTYDKDAIKTYDKDAIKTYDKDAIKTYDKDVNNISFSISYYMGSWCLWHLLTPGLTGLSTDN